MSQKPNDFLVRPASARDAADVLRLVRELAEYERAPHEVVATEADFLRDGFGPEPLFHVLVAERDERVVGFALYFFAYSTWQGRPVLYLEDLFVEPAHRKHGVGLSLMRALADVAVQRGCTRFCWQVLDWNAPAIAFYEKLGATVLPEWRSVRLAGEALLRFAGR
jgi:GNAT superfamily N-acetyltransferase